MTTSAAQGVGVFVLTRTMCARDNPVYNTREAWLAQRIATHELLPPTRQPLRLVRRPYPLFRCSFAAYRRRACCVASVSSQKNVEVEVSPEPFAESRARSGYLATM
jgi:hypothetical protein